MSQINQRSREAATYIGLETQFASLPAAMHRAFPVEGTFAAELEQTELDNLDESTRLYDVKATVRGLKGGSVKFELYGKVPATQLLDSVSVTPNYLDATLRAALGSFAGDEGSTIASAGPLSFDVQAGNGTRFEVGQWIAVQTGSQLEPCRITSIATDTIRVYPALSGTPGATDLVVNSNTYAPAPNHTGTLHLQHAKSADTAHGLQWSISGSTTSLTFDVKRNELFKVGVECQAASWTGPVDQAFVTSSASDTSMTAPFAVRDAITIFQPVATTTRNSYCLLSADVKINGGMEFIECLGATEGKAGAFRKGQRIFAEATLKFRFDPDTDATQWTAQQLMSCIIMVPKGTGVTKRFLVLDMPTCRIVGKPKIADENGMVYCEVMLQAAIDTTTTGSTSDMALAPFRIALI